MIASVAFAMLQSDITYTHQKSLSTLGGEIVNPGITVKLEMRDVLEVYDAQT